MGKYAEKTSVSVEASQAEIQKVLRKYGASAFAIDWNNPSIMFEIQHRTIRLSIPLPSKKALEFTETHRKRNVNQIDITYEQVIRQRWRSLLLMIKAKLEAIDNEITTLEQEFLPYLIIRDDQGKMRSVSEVIIPQLKDADFFPQLSNKEN